VPGLGESIQLDLQSKRRISVTLVGIRYSVQRRTIFLSGGHDTGCLHAVQLRIVNTGGTTVDAGPVSVTIATASGRTLEGDVLADLAAIPAGEALEGWVVFEIVDGDVPTAVSYQHETGATARWSLGLLRQNL
jgi:hypothetical protein